jgi:hypothetical protein
LDILTALTPQELQALKSGYHNLKQKHSLLVKRPKLSQHSKIAVIGAGPSLSEDLGWFKKKVEKQFNHILIYPL